MKKTVERFNITVAPTQTVKVPFNAEILNFDILNGLPGFNAIVEDGQRDGNRSFLITTFGKDLPPHLNKTRFIGAFELRDRRKEAEKGAKNLFFVFEE